MKSLQRTPLYSAHVSANAKMVDFSGWEMPLHYGSQMAEHALVRERAGVFDVSHMCPADLSGADAKIALQTLMANDVDKLAVGQALYTAMLNEEGGCIDDLIIYRLTPNAQGERYRIVHNAGRAQEDINWVNAQIRKNGWQVHYQPRHDLAMLAIQGPQAVACALRLPEVAPFTASLSALKNFHVYEADQEGHALYARTGYTGEDGMEWMIPAHSADKIWRGLIAQGIKPCGLGARDTLRLEAGMCLYGQDLDEAHSPLECGIGWSVVMNKGRDFIGRAALEKKPSQQKSIGLILREGGVLRAHLPVRPPGDDREAMQGEITSGGFSPTIKCSIALARVPLTINVGEQVEVNLRGKWLPALVVKPPFVRHGKVLVAID